MIPITVEDFADNVIKHNEGLSRKELLDSLREALTAKNSGKCCAACGQTIWAVGSALSGNYLCFTCCTGSWDDSEDYEIF